MDGTFAERVPCGQSPSRAFRQTGKMVGEERLRKERGSQLESSPSSYFNATYTCVSLFWNKFGSLDMSLGWRFSAF